MKVVSNVVLNKLQDAKGDLPKTAGKLSPESIAIWKTLEGAAGEEICFSKICLFSELRMCSNFNSIVSEKFNNDVKGKDLDIQGICTVLPVTLL